MRARALADLLGFLAEHPAPLILDEIQYTPDLLHYLEDQIARDRRAGRWLLSGSLFDWCSTGGLEVDLIVERHGHLYAMEVKATARPAPPHAEALARWLALADPRARGVLACRIEAPHTAQARDTRRPLAPRVVRAQGKGLSVHTKARGCTPGATCWPAWRPAPGGGCPPCDETGV